MNHADFFMAVEAAFPGAANLSASVEKTLSIEGRRPYRFADTFVIMIRPEGSKLSEIIRGDTGEEAIAKTRAHLSDASAVTRKRIAQLREELAQIDPEFAKA